MNINIVAWWIIVLGAVNVGLMALNFNLVEMLFSFSPQLVQIVYLLVGVSGLYYLLTAFSGTGKKKRK